jgi:hypothetical protein
VRAKASLVSTSWHNSVLNLAEFIVIKHTAELNIRRREFTSSSSHGLDDTRWLQEVESFIDEVIEESGCHARGSPQCLRAVRWMIASATAQFSSPRTPNSVERACAVVAATD